jgi:AraC-like DNA-binding protein
MPSSATLHFTDPEAYQAAIRPARVELCLTGRGEFHAQLTQIELGRLWIQAGAESLPRISNTLTSARRPPIIFLADAAQAGFRYGGMEVAASAVVVNSAGSTHHLRTSGPARWAAMSLTPNDLTAASQALLGHGLSMPSLTYIASPDPAHMRRLVRLHATAVRLAYSASATLAHPEVARALEHALVGAMLSCLADDPEVSVERRVRHHATILTRLEEFLATNCSRPIYLAEICAAVGASERTLRVCCDEHLGMGPIRYLWLRRMHLARHALSLADPATTTVTQVATRFGFWELGRFAVAYRRLFGEPPSVSLHRAARERSRLQNRPSDFVDFSIS